MHVRKNLSISSFQQKVLVWKILFNHDCKLISRILGCLSIDKWQTGHLRPTCLLPLILKLAQDETGGQGEPEITCEVHVLLWHETPESLLSQWWPLSGTRRVNYHWNQGGCPSSSRIGLRPRPKQQTFISRFISAISYTFTANFRKQGCRLISPSERAWTATGACSTLLPNW